LNVNLSSVKYVIFKNARVFAAVWALVIFVLCATPGQYIPSASWLEMLSFDKFVHAFMFYTLCTFLFLVGLKENKASWFFAFCFLICVIYGASLEWMQAKVFSNRSADWKDMAANTFGCLIALLLLQKLKKWMLHVR
jgi:VanZ family protein